MKTKLDTQKVEYRENTLTTNIDNHKDIPADLTGEVDFALKNLKNSKAAIIEGITAELIEYACRNIWKILAEI